MSAYNFSRSGSRPRRSPSIDSEEGVGVSFIVVYLLDSAVKSNFGVTSGFFHRPFDCGTASTG
jgi:hypothetical protein